MKRRSRAQLWGMLGALTVGLGLLGVATFWQPPDLSEMRRHWQVFLARPNGWNALWLYKDFHDCQPARCIAWSGLDERDVARMTVLAQSGAQAGQLDAVRLELALQRIEDSEDIGFEDTVLCCGPLIKSRPRRFLELSRDARLTTTQVVTASQLETDEDYDGYGRELRARRAALAGVGDASLAAWRDRDMAALDAALKHNQAALDKLNAD